MIDWAVEFKQLNKKGKTANKVFLLIFGIIVFCFCLLLNIGTYFLAIEEAPILIFIPIFMSIGLLGLIPEIFSWESDSPKVSLSSWDEVWRFYNPDSGPGGAEQSPQAGQMRYDDDSIKGKYKDQLSPSDEFAKKKGEG